MKSLVSSMIFSVLVCFTHFASAQDNSIEIITNNIVKVCDKPDNAGSYWDVRVKGDGEAAIKLKLAKIGITGEAEFSKGEWEGVKSTVENAKNYRDCVKSLAPIFIDKFLPLMPQKQDEKPRPRILGGIKWQEFGLGIDMTLNACSRQSSTVICNLTVKANDSDVRFYIYGRSAIYDQNGKKYDSNYASIANFKSGLKSQNSKLIGELIRGIDTKITLKFSDVGEDAKIISKAMVVAYVDGKKVHSSHTYAFRNVKIQIK